MAVAFLREFKIDDGDRSTTNCDAVLERLDLEKNCPAGLIVHTVGWAEEAAVFRILDVWESRAEGEASIRDRLEPLLDEGPINPDNAVMPDREDLRPARRRR
jgi:hypothetical protein